MCANLTSVTIGSSLSNLGESAFRNCPKLVTIIFNNDANDTPLLPSSYAFYTSSRTKTLIVTKNDTIRNYGWSQDNREIVIATNLAPTAILYSSGIMVFQSHDGIELSHGNPVSMYTGWDTEVYSSNNQVPWFNDGNYTKIKNVIINDSIFTTSTAYWFTKCTNLSRVVIGDSVVSIGVNTFNGCTGLKSIKIPNNVTSISQGAFNNCDNLTTIIFNHDADDPILFPTAGSSTGAFHVGSTMKTVVATNNNTIKNYGWATDNRNATFGDPVPTAILYNDGTMVFQSHNSIDSTHGDVVATYTGWDTETYSSYSNVPWYKDGNYSKIINVVINDDIDPTSTSHWFNRCRKLTSAYIGASVVGIGDQAFYFCTALTNIVIADGVTSIGYKAFGYCTSLTSISIPRSVTTIGSSALLDCNSLTRVNITDLGTWCGITFGDKYANGLNIADLYLNGELVDEMVIPLGVTAIKPYAFAYYDGLTSVAVSSSVTEIGSYAFYDCKNCESITGMDNVKNIERYAFYGCSKISNMKMPAGITSIGEYAFYGCAQCFTDVVIPEGVSSIKQYSFYGCTSMIHVTIPSSAITIERNAFYGCSGLKSVTITNGILSIVDYAFRNCSSLQSIIIPDSVTSIGSYAFCGCSSLAEATIGYGVTFIGNYVFSECTNLDSATFKNTNGWAVYQSLTAANGTPVVVTEPDETATYLTSTYCNYFWKQK
jgi:hypothetical protein